jgi:L-threonylcarbamoyladenylate synthase
MILYPTETLYALGVNALDVASLQSLYALKGRDASRPASWLVRDMDDVVRYAEISDTAAKIALQFLPGKLTLILKAVPDVPKEVIAADGTIGFRISSDPVAQKVIAEYMQVNNAPLTCTSANVSGLATLGTVGEILQQFGARAASITKIVDDGPRKGLASTIVRVIGDEVTVLREGDISEADIRAVL